MSAITIRVADIQNDFQYIMPLFYDLQKQHTQALPKLFRNVKSYEDFITLIEDFDNQEDKIRLAKELDFLLLFEKDNIVIACAYVQDKIRVADIAFLGSHYLFVACFIVDSLYRGQGLGQMCFTNLKKWAINRGYTQIELSVLHNNKSAISLYETVGLTKELLTMSCELTRSIEEK